jgi:hypothetical protein
MMKRALLFFPLLALITALSGARLLYAEGPAAPPAAQGHDHAQQGDAGQPAAPEAARTQPSMGGHRMMQSRSAGNAELTRLLEAMNAATAADKTTAMAALLTRLVQDQLAMSAMMHGSMPSSMPQCPMMSKESGGNQHQH